MYLPLRLSAAILAGGLVGALARRSAGESTEAGSSRGLLFAAGLVTGEALMGILLAVPIALTRLWPTLGADPFQLFETPPLGGWPGLLVLAAGSVVLYPTARGRRHCLHAVGGRWALDSRSGSRW